ncbi:hypothetical protein ANO11243_025650 [Dothideomycetidae sp. 11243]|nr:hypothetical protein ANO11243_025650 [fungal sp. No.11243]
MGDSSRVRDNTYVNGHGQAVVKTHQDRTAENTCGYLLPTLKKLTEANPKVTLIDIGCGVGSITVGLAAYIPQGTVTAFDLSENVLAPARAAAEAANATNIEFATGTVLDLPFPDDSFDVVHGSQMLQHLTDRETGLREMYRVCKPGGVVAVRDMCLHTWTISPQPEWWTKWHGIVMGQLNSTHIKGRDGPQALALCLSIGIKAAQVKSSAGCWVWATPEERIPFAEAWAKRITDSPMAEWALKDGGYSKKQLEDIGKGWIEWSREPAGWLGVMNAEVLITK